MKDVVLITGASTGFGRVTAEVLAGHGYRVFATMRDITGNNAEACKTLDAIENIEVLELDVTKDDSVEGAITKALQRAGRIDIVINNAGFANLGLTEAYSPRSSGSFTRRTSSERFASIARCCPRCGEERRAC